MINSIGIIGGGSWGLALANLLSKNSIKSLISIHDPKDLSNLKEYSKSKYFPNHSFSKLISYTDSIEEVINYSSFLIVALPIKNIYETLSIYKNILFNKNILIVSKGIYKGKVVSDILSSLNKNTVIGVLSGPSFSSEVILDKLTCVVVASKEATFNKEYQEAFNSSTFRVYTSFDLVGVEICGAFKNVYAIGSGIIDQYNLGNNAKAAYLTRSLAELKKLVLRLDGKLETLLGLAGIGDLFLTCNSSLSRNYNFGLNFKGAIDEKETIEGLNTLKSLLLLANEYSIDLPIAKEIYEVIFKNKDARLAFDALMSRKTKDEY